jgi:hypothetical protein
LEVLEALACIAEIERKIDNLFRHGPVTERRRIDGAGSFACALAVRRQVALAADWLSLSKRRLPDETRLRNTLL